MKKGNALISESQITEEEIKKLVFERCGKEAKEIKFYGPAEILGASDDKRGKIFFSATWKTY